MTPAQAETARQIGRAYPGWRVWVSDGGWWYATRARPWARGQSATVVGPTPEALAGELAAEDAAASAAHQAAMADPLHAAHTPAAAS
jgi:hypothetical protein